MTLLYFSWEMYRNPNHNTIMEPMHDFLYKNKSWTQFKQFWVAWHRFFSLFLSTFLLWYKNSGDTSYRGEFIIHICFCSLLHKNVSCGFSHFHLPFTIFNIQIYYSCLSESENHRTTTVESIMRVVWFEKPQATNNHDDDKWPYDWG